MMFPVASSQWRHWQNTELYVETYGLRLDEVSDAVREAAMAVLRASLSPKGYAVSRDVMRLNRFLGDLLGSPAVLGEWSYIFCLFGVPSEAEPWGWQLFGHHLSLNCFVLGGQMVLSPTFMGAEPAFADTGPFAGISLFEDEERAGLALMRSLDSGQQRHAIVAHAMMGGDLPPDAATSPIISISAAPIATTSSSLTRASRRRILAGAASQSPRSHRRLCRATAAGAAAGAHRGDRAPPGARRISAGSAASTRRACSTIAFRAR